MIIKQCQFPGKDDRGSYIHLIHPGEDNNHLIKTAQVSPPQLDHVRKVVKGFNKSNGHVYVLVSAMGAGEYWGSNSNGDDFPEEALIHVPPGWGDMSISRQRSIGAAWEWGYPTFYNAHAFQHHVNKDVKRAFGSVIYAMWDSHMKRVLLVIDIDRAAAKRMGAHGIVDKIENGEYPDVSMGCKVPFDVCSICADWTRITPLLGKPKKLLAEHRRKPIRGISVTRNDYCQHLQFEINKIYPDGRKVKMVNAHPKFFDLSFVFIGADKTSKVMAKLAGAQLCPIKDDSPMCKKGCFTCAIPASHVYDVWSKGGKEKVAMTLTPFEEYVVENNKADRDAGEIQDIPKKEMERLKKEFLKDASAIAKHVGKRTGIGAGVGGVIGGTHSGLTSEDEGSEADINYKWGIPGFGKEGSLQKEAVAVSTELEKMALSYAKPFDPEQWKKSRARMEAASIQGGFDPASVKSYLDSVETRAIEVDQATKAVMDQNPSMLYPAARAQVIDPKAKQDVSGMPVLRKQSSVEPEQDELAAVFGIDKTAEISLAKKAEIIKQIRSNFSKALPGMENNEPELPKELMESLAGNLPDALASAGSLGIIAKPKEFQRMILISRGHPQLADALDSRDICFNPGAPPSSDHMIGQVVPKILDALTPLMGERSALAPAIHRRIIKITVIKPSKRSGSVPEDLKGDPVLNKISADYSAYRQQLLYKAAHLIRQTVHEHPELLFSLLESAPEEAFIGGLVKAGGDVMESIIGMFPVDYLNKVYLDQPVSQYVDERCDLSSLVTAGDLASCGRIA